MEMSRKQLNAAAIILGGQFRFEKHQNASGTKASGLAVTATQPKSPWVKSMDLSIKERAQNNPPESLGRNQRCF